MPSYRDEDLLSSPDPLGDDSVYQSPPKRNAAKARRRSQPLQGSSPKKQMFELDVGNQLSPQKIRVTVEAGSDIENAFTHRVDRALVSPSPFRQPANRRGERTTTTTIPVKGLSDTEEEVNAGAATPKRGRGRPRKTSGTPVGANKKGRASTPVKKSPGRRKSIGDLVDGDDSADWDFHIGKGVEVGRGKGRSRSRSKKGSSRNATPAPKKTATSDIGGSSVVSKRGRRKSLMPNEVVVLQDDSEPEEDQEYPEEPAGFVEDIAALATIDPNISHTRSTHSPRSTTSRNSGNVEDAIANSPRSQQHNDMPRRNRLSSPRTADTSRNSTSTRHGNKFPSPSITPEESEMSQYGEGSIAMAPVSSPEKPQEHSLEQDDDPNNDDYLDKGGDIEDEEPREFDTIIESEGFSMISVDSVPSLREHISSPAVREQEMPKEPPRNRSLLSVRDTDTRGQDDSFSSIPAEVLEAATPGRVAQNRKLLSIQGAKNDDSFSSIPPEVLDAATPRLKSHVSRLFSTKDSRLEDSFSSIAPEILDAATPARPSRSQSPPKNTQDNGENEDSFSATPSADLDAPTPAPVRQTLLRPSSIPQTGTSNANQSAPSSASLAVPNLAPPRLPTPEATPSPPNELSSPPPPSGSDGKGTEPQSVTEEVPRPQATDESLLIYSQIRSSPPSLAPHRSTQAKHVQQQQFYPDLTATPLVQFSSPSLPPPINVQRGPNLQSIGQLEAQRPQLSPIVRSGRALQDLVVPSSPRSRTQSLGSPFKSPSSERMSSSMSRESDFRQESRGKTLPELALEGNLFPNLGNGSQTRPQSSSSRHQSRGQSQEPSSQNSRWTKSRHSDDPFGKDAGAQLRSPSPEEKQAYSLEMPGQRRRSDPNLLSTGSDDVSILNYDVMSWQADVNSPAKNTPSDVSRLSEKGRQSSANRENTGETGQSWEERWASHRAAVSRQVDSANTSQVIVIDSDDESQISTTTHRHGEYVFPDADDDAEGYSLLLETINSSSPSVEQRQIEQQMFDNFDKPRRSKIPSPWRKNSKRLVYSDELLQLSSPYGAPNSSTQKEVRREGSTQPITVRRITPRSSEARQDPPIGQKSNFAPRVRSSGNFDISALLGSPAKELPVLSSASQNSSIPQQNHSALSSQRRVSDTAISPAVQDNGKRSEDSSVAQSMQPIPQKVGFRPRVRSHGMQDLSALLNSPIKGLPTLPSSSENGTIQMQGSSNIAPSSDLPNSATISQSDGSSGLPYSSPTPQQTFNPVPQKMGFKPRVREGGDTAMSEQLTSSPVKKSALFSPTPLGSVTKTSPLSTQANAASTPLLDPSSSRRNSLQVHSCSLTEQSPPAYVEEDSYDADGKENQVYYPTLGVDNNAGMPVPQYINFSPTKSILRSPIKPTFREQAGKTVGWVSSSPSQSEQSSLLSPITWSLDHWDLLNRIRKAWEPEGWSRDPNCPKLPAVTPNKRRRSLNQTSVVSKLLGRVVTSQGERMRLEQWQLEAVDEFREEVPGWEELAIAIRLFSLVIGEERRKDGTVGLRRAMRAAGEDPDAEWKAKKAAKEA